MKSRRINVLYDHQIFSLQEYGGISRLFVELIKEYSKNKDINTELSLAFSNNAYLPEIDINRSFFSKYQFPRKRKLMEIINKVNSLDEVRKESYDIFHPTYYDPYFLSSLKNRPFVLTVHDMTHELFPETMNEKDKTSENKKTLIPKASQIIAVSQNTKKDILKFFDVDPNKITVVYNATSLKRTVKKMNLKLPSRYILFVGVRSGYKNFINAFEAIKPLLQSDKELYFVCAGSKPFSPNELEFFEENDVKNQVIHIPFSSNDELSTIYQQAILDVVPSLYEGFGIQLLESLACGCPTVVSNASCFPEVALDSVVYFDPQKVESIREGITRVLKSKSLQGKLTKAGLKRAHDFSWKKAAQETAEVYKKV